MSNLNILSPDTGIDLTAHGIRINRLLDYDSWLLILSQLRCIKSTYLSAVSDVVTYGRQHFGDAKVNTALEQLEFELSDATKAEAIGLIDLDTRTRHNLSAEQAYVIATGCRTEEERENWAIVCEKNGLTAFELKKSIAAGKVLRKDEITSQSGHGEGIASVQSVRFQFEKLRHQFKDDSAVLRLPKEERMKILEQLSPIVEFAAKIEGSLSWKPIP